MLKKPVLTGERVVLRPITEADAGAMFASLSDEESMRLTGTQGKFTFKQVQQYCRRIETTDDNADYAIPLKGEGTYLGEVVLNDNDWLNRSANFRIALAAKQHFGKRYGSETTRMILEFGF